MIYSLTSLMNDFQEAVKKKEYSKIPYDHWRNLKERAKCNDKVDIVRDLVAQRVNMYCFGVKTEYRFELDYPFGEFLWNVLKNHEDNTLESAVNKMKDSFNTFAESAKTTTASLNTTLPKLNEYAVINSASIKSNYENAYGYGVWDANDSGLTTNSIEITSDYLKINGKKINEIIDEAMGNSISNRKEKDNMDLIKNFDFGSCKNDNVKVSMYGIAVKNAAGTWVSYDSKTGSIIDVDIFNFDGKYLYKMPVAIKDIAVGDTVIHNRKPVFVTKVEDGKILAIDPAAGEEKVIILTKNMFGFDFVTKVVNLFSGFMNGATADSPFGNMLPLMLMNEGKTDDMLPLMFLMNGGKMDMSNPMMMYFLMKDGKAGNDMLPFLLMSNFNGNKCTCDCDREG